MARVLFAGGLAMAAGPLSARNDSGETMKFIRKIAKMWKGFTILFLLIVSLTYYLKYEFLLWDVGAVEDNFNIYEFSVNAARSSTPEEAVGYLLYVNFYYPRGARLAEKKDFAVTPLTRMARIMVTRSIIESVQKKTDDPMKPFSIYEEYLHHHCKGMKTTDSRLIKLTETALYKEIGYWVKKYGNEDAQIKLKSLAELLYKMYGIDPSRSQDETTENQPPVQTS